MYNSFLFKERGKVITGLIIILTLYGFYKFFIGSKQEKEKLHIDISPREFEVTCANWLIHRGYNIELTPYWGDGNIDIYVKDRDNNLIGIAECKKWKREVGVTPLKILIKTMQDIGVQSGWFFSLNGFSRAAQNYAHQIQGYKINLIEGKEIL